MFVGRSIACPLSVLRSCLRLPWGGRYASSIGAIRLTFCCGVLGVVGSVALVVGGLVWSPMTLSSVFLLQTGRAVPRSMRGRAHPPRRVERKGRVLSAFGPIGFACKLNCAASPGMAWHSHALARSCNPRLLFPRDTGASVFASVRRRPCDVTLSPDETKVKQKRPGAAWGWGSIRALLGQD